MPTEKQKRLLAQSAERRRLEEAGLVTIPSALPTFPHAVGYEKTVWQCPVDPTLWKWSVRKGGVVIPGGSGEESSEAAAHAAADEAIPLPEIKTVDTVIPPEKEEVTAPVWCYGITTITERLKTTFPRTLASLRSTGFHEPYVFVDDAVGSAEHIADTFELQPYSVISRDGSRIRAFGNWWLGMVEMYVRNPNADRYVMFQDDVLAARNLRKYLESFTMPEKGYWNLYLWGSNQQEAERRGVKQWFLSNQFGRGALGLVFSNLGLRDLLATRHFVDRPRDPERGHKFIDGGIVEAMKKIDYKEYVHYPSLLQHIGEESAVRPGKQFVPAMSFPGVEYDLLDLLR